MTLGRCGGNPDYPSLLYEGVARHNGKGLYGGIEP